MKKVLYFFVIVLCTPFFLKSQNENTPKKDSLWKTGASLGLDFSQLFQLNPRQGAGQNRIGAGTAITAFAKIKKKRDWPGITRSPGSSAFSE